MEAQLIKFGHGLFALSRASFLASSKSCVRCASRAFSFSRTLVNDSSYENASSSAFIDDSWVCNQMIATIFCYVCGAAEQKLAVGESR
jgi:hypothetical protein